MNRNFEEMDAETITAALSKATVDQLTHELRSRGLPTIVWQPGDMEGFGNPDASLEDRLEDCRKSLEDRSVEVGWDIIAGVIGHTQDPETSSDMKNYVVLYRDEKVMAPLDAPLGFQCWAESADHAEEQCYNAHPGVDIVWVWVEAA